MASFSGFPTNTLCTPHTRHVPSMYTQTNVGLLCCVGSDSNVAVALRNLLSICCNGRSNVCTVARSNCPYPEPTPSSPHDPLPTSWRSILILSSHLRLDLPNGLFHPGFPTNTLCTPLSSLIRATFLQCIPRQMLVCCVVSVLAPMWPSPYVTCSASAATVVQTFAQSQEQPATSFNPLHHLCWASPFFPLLYGFTFMTYVCCMQNFIMNLWHT